MHIAEEVAGNKEMVPVTSEIFLYSQPLETETLLFRSLVREPFLATLNDLLNL